MNNIALPRLIVWGVTILALPFAMLIGSWIGEGRTRELFIMVGLSLLGVLLLWVPQWLWVFAIGSMFVPGQLPFLPLPFRPMELFLLLLMARFIVEDVVFKKRWIKLGPSPDSLFILGLLVVVLWHGFHDRFAMRSLGSPVWGGRNYFSMILGFTAYFMLQSTTLDRKPFRHLPSIVLAFGFVDFLFNLTVFLMPSLSGTLGNFYGGDATDSGELFAKRLGFAGNFGYLLLFWSLSNCRFQDFLHKGRIVKATAFCLGFMLCAASGYRSSLLLAAIITAVAAFRDFRFAAIFMLIPVSLVFSALIGLHLSGIRLPVTIQRGLVWVPGAGWDEAATTDAIGSDEFRSEIWELWLKTEFPKHPILGRGFGLSYEDMIATLPFLSEEGASMAWFSKYNRNEAFVVSGNIHHGFFSTVDRFGLIGGLCFILWTFWALRRMFRELVTSRHAPMNPALQWLGLYVISFTIGFPMGALRTENFLPQQLILCGMFTALLAASKSPPKPQGGTPSLKDTAPASKLRPIQSFPALR